jgi:hypothetical membrane protein
MSIRTHDQTMERTESPPSAATTDARSRPTRTSSGQRTHEALAGALLTLTGIGVILAIITNEALYPAARHYSTFANSISDLSGTEPPTSYMVEPNRLIFIGTMAIGGVLLLSAVYLLRQVIQRRRILVGMSVFGVGLLGIAVFPGNVAGWHPLFALACFVGGSVTAIMSRKILEPPVRSFAAVLGTVALIATFLGLDAFANVVPQTMIGIGGVERWIAYPVLLWLVMFGTALMTRGPRGGEI